MQSQPQFGTMPVAPPPMPPQNPNGIPPLPVYTTQQPQFHWPNGAIQTTAQMTANAPIVPPQHNEFGIPITPTLAASMRSGKKDPKRRTKTGCLTCRKRRIKCDEGHPVCRNCQKSKRECLGYDPIFKRETGHAPIQPAPSNTSTPTQSSKPPTPSIGASYQQQPSQAYSATGGTFVPATNPAQQAESGTEYAAPSLDPALATGGQRLAMATNTLRPFRKYKHLQIEQLFSINDIPPPAAGPSVQSLSFDQATQHEMNDFYRFHFAPGLDKLFETNWYSTRGWQYIQQHTELPHLISQAMEHFRSEDPSIARTNQSLEARLVWQLATLPRSSNSISEEFLPRIDTVEHLIRGDHLHPNQVPPAPTVAERSDAIKYNEKNFWHNLGAFTAHYDEDPDPDRAAERAQAINKNLNTMRGILGIMENRDVLYSLAIGRYIGGRLDNFDPRQPLAPSSNDPNDEINKLEVARRHVEMESMKGLTQVVQVICRMAIRGWILQKQP